MRRLAPLILLVLPGAALSDQTRCGWYSNPTPANYDLEDADGVWILSVQGRGEVPGFFDATQSATGRSEWIAMSPAGYGFGCACVVAEFGELGSGLVRRVQSLRHLPLARCAQDPALSHRDLNPMGED